MPTRPSSLEAPTRTSDAAPPRYPPYTTPPGMTSQRGSRSAHGLRPFRDFLDAGGTTAYRRPPSGRPPTDKVSQLSRDDESDDAEQMLKELGRPVFFVPGDHDTLDPAGGKAFLNRFGKGSQGAGWYSFDHRGVHFVALVNVADLKPGGMGNLGPEQLKWLKADLARQSSSTPIVVFAHIPLWTVYADWGWGTDDAAQALKLLARFGSVTVLNGHIHQITQKVEGRVAFHTARSTAFPQPAPGTAPSPGPLKVPPEQLHDMLGITDAMFVRGHDRIALIDSTLSA